MDILYKKCLSLVKQVLVNKTQGRGTLRVGVSGIMFYEPLSVEYTDKDGGSFSMTLNYIKSFTNGGWGYNYSDHGAFIIVINDNSGKFQFINWTSKGSLVGTFHLIATAKEETEYPWDAEWEFQDGYGGSLQVASTADLALWSIDNGEHWNEKDAEISLLAGTKTIVFKPVENYTKPADKSVTIFANNTASVTGVYSPLEFPSTLKVVYSGRDSIYLMLERVPDPATGDENTLENNYWRAASSVYGGSQLEILRITDGNDDMYWVLTPDRTLGNAWAYAPTDAFSLPTEVAWVPIGAQGTVTVEVAE